MGAAVADTPDKLKESIDSGEYFQEALKWYSTVYHSPINSRAMLVIITGLISIISFLTVLSVFLILPLEENRPVPLRVSNSDEKVGKVRMMLQDLDDTPDDAIKRWLIKNFVLVRESYDINYQETFHKRVWALSSEPVYKEYVQLYRGDESPTIKYERHTIRTVAVTSITYYSDKAKVDFTASEESASGEKKTLWQADIAFRYEEIKVDQSTGKVAPMKFEVTKYQSKPIG